MSAVAQTDAGIHAANTEDILHQERSAIRDNIPLHILVGTCEMSLKRFESDFDVFIQSIPEIDPETLNLDNRNCPVCWTDFTLQLKHDPSTHSERNPTPLRLPCAHHVCRACIHDWLPRAGTCPLCRQQFGPQNGIYITTEHEKWFRLREPYEAIAEIAPIYLASNPNNDTFGEFVLWLFASQNGDPDALETRAQLAMDRFQGYTMGLLEVLRHDPAGRQLLMKFRDGKSGRAPMKDSGNEYEVRSDGGDIMEENLETFDDADAVSEGYSSNGEATDDDREEIMENENADTASSTVGEEEDIMDEREEDEEDLMDENGDADPAVAAWGEEEDSTDEGEDFDEMGDDEDDSEYELEEDEQHTPVAVLGCAAVVSMVGMGLLMNL